MRQAELMGEGIGKQPDASVGCELERDTTAEKHLQPDFVTRHERRHPLDVSSRVRAKRDDTNRMCQWGEVG